MEIIIALLMFNCDLHINKEVCVDTHVSCVEMVSTLKKSIGGHLLTKEERLAAAYLYCVETGGQIDGSLDLPGLFDASYEGFEGFQLWEKTDHWKKMERRMELQLAKESNN